MNQVRKAAKRTHKLAEYVSQDGLNSLIQLEDLLDPKLSYSLVEMSRLLPENRQKNEDFTTMLKRKL